jgi:hypothetical protein
MKHLSMRLLLIVVGALLVGNFWALPLIAPDAVPTDAYYEARPELAMLEEIVRLPLYTEEELEALRGLPLSPNSDSEYDTFYLPPGVAKYEDLPPCVEKDVDDPATEVNEKLEAAKIRAKSGVDARNIQLLVVDCQTIIPPENIFYIHPDDWDEYVKETR